MAPCAAGRSVRGRPAASAGGVPRLQVRATTPNACGLERRRRGTPPLRYGLRTSNAAQNCASLPKTARKGGTSRTGAARRALRFSAAPHLVGHPDDQLQLGPLVVDRQLVALLGRGEAALGREAELLD